MTMNGLAATSLAFTRWASKRSKTGTQACATWAELGAFLATPLPPPEDPADPNLPGWSPAIFEENRRLKERVAFLTCLGLDIDTGALSLGALREAFEGRRAFVHNTKSSTPEAPTWRIVVDLSRPITPAEHALVLAHERDRLALLGIELDEKTKDPSRLWFVPCRPLADEFLFEELEGEPLDVDAVLLERVASPTPLERARRDAGATGEQPWLASISESSRKRRASAWLRHADVAVQGNRGSDDAMRAATAVVRGFALGRSSALEVLAEWNARCEPPWSDEELVHKVDEADRKGRMAWGEKLRPPRDVQGATSSEREANSEATPRLGPTALEPLRGLDALSKVAVFGAARIRELAAVKPAYVWQDIALPGIVVVLAGGPGEGKTTLLFLLLAARLTLGAPLTLLGRQVEPIPPGRFVVLIEGEHGETSAARKLVSSCEILGVDPTCLDRIILVARKAVRLGEPAWEDVVAQVRAGLVSDIAIDTIARVAPADADNEREQVAVFDTIAQAIEAAPSEETKPLAWVVAHTRKNGNGDSLADVSGSTQRTGQADTVLIVKGERHDGRVVSSTVTFSKLREEPDDYPTAVTFAITTDAEGRRVLADVHARVKDDRPLEERIVDQLRLGPRAKNRLGKELGRSAADIEQAISNLFSAHAIVSTTVRIRGREYRAFDLNRSGGREGQLTPDSTPDSHRRADEARRDRTQSWDD